MTATASSQYIYDPYGRVIRMQGDLARENPFRHSCEYADDETGLIYYNYRYYNTQDGRWINRDPIAEQGGLNLYAYVGNGVSWLGDMLGFRYTRPYKIQGPKDPNDPIFLTAVVDIYFGEGVVQFTTDDQFKKFDQIVDQISKKKNKCGEPCYKITLVLAGSMDKETVKKLDTGTAYIIGHGTKDKKIELNDGLLSKDEMRIPCHFFGCYLGGNKGEVPVSYAFNQLIASLKKLLDDCPEKTHHICIMSGPVNSKGPEQ